MRVLPCIGGTGFQRVVFTRLELYESVWEKPVTKVAQDIGLTSAAVAKACREHGIPVPSAGYWMKLEYGKQPKKPPLPEPEDSQNNEVQFLVRKKQDIDEEQNALAQVKIAEEENEANTILVPATCENPHSMVQLVAKELRAAKSDEYGMVQTRAKDTLDVKVHRNSIDRACRILDTLVRALERRGIEVAVIKPKQDGDRWPTVVSVLGESLRISMEELLDKKEKVRAPNAPRSYYSSRPEYEFFASGKLALRIVEGCGYNIRRRWADSSCVRLEQYMNLFIVGLYSTSVIKRSDRLEREKKEREWERKDRIRRRRYKRALRAWKARERERKRTLKLVTDARNLAKSERIRSYINAVRVAAKREGRDTETGTELGDWIQWAEVAADRYDPLLTQEIYDENKREEKPEEYDF